jgi:hypothetical protein
MARFVTSVFLALILVDIAAATGVPTGTEMPEPPQGMRRMIETLERKNTGTYHCTLEGRGRRQATHDRNRVCRSRW